MAAKTVVLGFRSRWSPVALQERMLPATLAQTQLRIDVRHIALNPIDIKLKTLGFVPIAQQTGREFAGTIAEVGAALAGQYAVGERVSVLLVSAFDGIVGTTAVIDATKHAVIKTPARLSDAEAAAFPVALGTAFTLLDTTAKRGTLLVLGGGSMVGAFAVQLAKRRFGFERVVVTCSAASAPRVTALGADETVDYKAGDLSAQLVRLGVRFDAIVDAVGGYDALRVWPRILKTPAEGGVYATSAGDPAPSGRYSASFLLPTLASLPWVVPRLLFGRYVGIDYRFTTLSGGPWTAEAPELLAGGVKIPIDSVYAKEDVRQAWERLDAGAHGKVLVDMRS